MKFKLVFIFFIIEFLVSCSSSSNSSVSENSNNSETFFDGTYQASVVAVTQVGIDGGACGNASGILRIDNSEISGTVLTSGGSIFDISGSVTFSGVVSGGFAQGGQNAATFEGNISGSQGSGTWEDIFECRGNWEMTKNQ